MEAIINKTIIACSDYPNATLNIRRLYNPEKFSDPDRLVEIACEAARLLIWEPSLYVTYGRKLYLIFGFLGVLSSILAILSYSLKEFQATAFYYYRAINMLDFGYMLYCWCLGANLSSFAESLPAHFAWEVAGFGARAVAKSAHLLVLWTACDRAVACTSAIRYRSLDNKRVAIGIILGICTYSIVYDIPFTYFDIRVRYFNGTNPIEPPLVICDRVQRGLEGILMLMFMTVVVIGLIRMSRRKRKLLGYRKEGNQDRGLLSQIRTNQSLCILQLCEGVPFVFVTILVYMRYITNFLLNYNLGQTDPLVAGGTYEENLSRQKKFIAQTYISAVFLITVDFYCHSFHFYNYMAFSPKFRRTVLSFLRRCRQRRVEPA